MGEIYLVRHAQASFKSADDYDMLSDLGLRQASILGEHLSRLITPDYVICGSMKRHMQTVGAYLSVIEPAPILTIEKGFNEFRHEDIIGQLNSRWKEFPNFRAYLDSHADPLHKFQEIFSSALERWLSGRYDTDYQESWPQFYTRVNDAFVKVKDMAGASKRIVIFTSGGPIAVMCRRLLDLGVNEMLDINHNLVNTGVTRLLYSRQKFSVSYLNNYGHLESIDRSLVTFI